VGTSAVREARNADELLRLIRQRCGLDIEIIDPEYEARLAFSSVSNAFNIENTSLAAVDLGGGSTELVFSSGGLVDSIFTLPLGAVRLTDLFQDRGEPGAYRFSELVDFVDSTIRETVGRPPYPIELLIGTGGTFTTLARLSIRSGSRPRGNGRFPFAVRGYEVSRREVSRQLVALRRMPLSERQRVAGMSAQRAEIIVAGLCVIERLMEHLDVNRLRVHDGGIRDGMLLEMIDEMGLDMARSPSAARAMLSSVRSFGQRMRYDKAHSEHVARLALRIFDQLAEQRPDAGGTWDRRELRDLLQAAGILHDIGIVISYPRHHRHSCEMILRGRLPLLSRREVEVIANIARYHRKRGPLPGDSNFKRLCPEDQHVVSHLAGILRIADGLDRSHARAVKDVVVHVEPDAVVFDAMSADEPLTDLRAAEQKADLFEAAFHAKTRFNWTPAQAPAVLERLPR
jgi:exopolyphosphatase/guanosine-5'-triphosphate,3'-diphosphate pyrophosphatase